MLHCDTLNQHILCFYFDDNTAEPILQFDLQKPICTVANAKIARAKMTMGSFDLKFKSSNSKPYFLKKIIPARNIDKNRDANDFIIIARTATDTTLLSIDLYRHSNSRRAIYLLPQLNENYKNLMLTWHLYRPDDEHYFGGGEQFSHVKLDGYRLSFLVEEQGIGRGDVGITQLANLRNAAGNRFTTFAPAARFVTTHKRLIVNTATWSAIDLRRRTVADFVCFSSTKINPFSLIIHQNKAAKLPKLTDALRGVPTPNNGVNDWFFGTILGVQGGTDTVLQKLKTLQRNGCKPSAVWIQDWCGRRVTPFGKQLNWNWQLDTVRYHHFSAFKAHLDSNNIRLLGYVNPFLADGLPLAREAVAKKYVVANADGQPHKIRATGFDVYLIDLQNAPAATWLRDSVIQKNLVDNGFSGWMADFGEWYPIDKNDAKTLAAHQLYPELWQKMNAEIKARQPEKQLNYFTRSAFNCGTLVQWAGDQNTTWGKNDGLPSLVPALLSSGWSGTMVNHGDIGGFTSFKKGFLRMTRNRELLCRWIELAAFTPVFRTHEGLAPDYNLQVYSDTAAARFFAKFSKIHDDLLPYLHKTYQEALQNGVPMIRHTWFCYPDDPNTIDLQAQFFLGSELLVLPVLRKGATTVRGYFPKGEWTHYFTKEKISSNGEWRTVNAPLGTPAVFLANTN